MPRLTPILALVLASAALYFLAPLWADTLVPLYRSVWYSDMVLKWRLGSDEPALRTAAVKDAGSWSAEDAALLDQLVASLKTDESRPVRNAAARSLGQLGSRRPLPAEATRALSALVLHEQDDSLLSAAIAAVGQSAARNRYPYAVIKRIAGISAEEHFAWVYSQSATALGQIGAAQPLSGPVFAMMNVRFLHPRRDGEREHIADAFAEIARSQYLPLTTLDMLAAAFARESNRHVRKSILYALAHSATYYPYSVTLITAATRDPDQDIVARAKHGLRIIKSNRSSASKGPLSVAMNSSLPVDTRLKALQIIRGARIDPAAHEQIVALAGDPETKIAAAAVEMFHWLTRSADDDFDQRVLIPALSRAMSDSESVVRYAAYGELSTMSRNEPAYLRAGDLPAQLEIAANDPDPRVRVVVLAMMLRDEAQRDAVIERGMDDPDPYVRSNAARWLTYPRVRTGPRQTFIAEVLADLNQDVRRSAAAAQEALKMRERDWPIALWQLWRTVERNKVGLRTLIAVTVATPILIGGMFLLYYMARLLSYLRQRRWRAAAAVPVMATWAAASSGMFLLYFAVGHAGDLDPSGIIILTSALWVGIACYATLGWGMHFAVRR